MATLTKAFIQNLDTNEKFNVQFNPTEYTIAKQNQWQAKPIVGKNVPNLRFTSGGARSMTMELIYDDYYIDSFPASEPPIKPIPDFIKFMWDLTMIGEKGKNSNTNRSRPPYCLFQWGDDYHFTAALTNLSMKYTLFYNDGSPMRVSASVTFQEAQDDKAQPKTNPTSGSLPGYKRRMVGTRETLPLIAFQEYGDSNRWRQIAQANDLDDPMALESGMVLLIPPLS